MLVRIPPFKSRRATKCHVTPLKKDLARLRNVALVRIEARALVTVKFSACAPTTTKESTASSKYSAYERLLRAFRQPPSSSPSCSSCWRDWPAPASMSISSVDLDEPRVLDSPDSVRVPAFRSVKELMSNSDQPLSPAMDLLLLPPWYIFLPVLYLIQYCFLTLNAFCRNRSIQNSMVVIQNHVISPTRCTTLSVDRPIQQKEAFTKCLRR